MPSRCPLRLMAALMLLLSVALPPLTATAQDATPAPNGGITAVATGLSAPRSFTWGPSGAIYVAQSGPGSQGEATGPRSSVAKIFDACPVAVAGGLPSTEDPFEGVLGKMDVQFVGSQLFILPRIDHTHGVTLLWYVFR